MQLADWFKVRNPDGSKRSKRAFAEAIGVGPSTITAYINGTWPGRGAMEKIARETDGAVTANDFVQHEAAE